MTSTPLFLFSHQKIRSRVHQTLVCTCLFLKKWKWQHCITMWMNYLKRREQTQQNIVVCKTKNIFELQCRLWMEEKKCICFHGNPFLERGLCIKWCLYTHTSWPSQLRKKKHKNNLGAKSLSKHTKTHTCIYTPLGNKDTCYKTTMWNIEFVEHIHNTISESL